MKFRQSTSATIGQRQPLVLGFKYCSDKFQKNMWGVTMGLSQILVCLPWYDLFGILNLNDVLQTMKNFFFSFTKLYRCIINETFLAMYQMILS